MKASVLQIPFAAAAVQIRCPENYTLKILAVAGAMTPADFDQLSVAYGFQGTTAIQPCSCSLFIQQIKFTAAIGLDSTQLTIANIDPISGAVSMGGSEDHAQFSLPDISFDHDLTLTVALQSANAISGTIFYILERR